MWSCASTRLVRRGVGREAAVTRGPLSNRLHKVLRGAYSASMFRIRLVEEEPRTMVFQIDLSGDFSSRRSVISSAVPRSLRHEAGTIAEGNDIEDQLDFLD